jgi:hypothetical protein
MHTHYNIIISGGPKPFEAVHIPAERVKAVSSKYRQKGFKTKVVPGPSVLPPAAESRTVPTLAQNVIPGPKPVKARKLRPVAAPVQREPKLAKVKPKSKPRKPGSGGHNTRPVICLTTGKHYPSILEAAQDIGGTPIGVLKNCKYPNVYPHHRGLVFAYTDKKD